MPSATVKFKPRLLQNLLAQFDVGAFHAHHDGNFDFQFARGGNHAVGQCVAAQNAAEDVDEHGFDARVGKQDAERILDLFGVCSAADIKEVRRLSAGVFDDVHGGHREARAVHHAGDVAVELDVVQAEARGFHFQRIFFVQIAQFQQIFVPVQRVVVEGDLGVEREDFAVFRQNERVDFGKRAVDRVVCLCQRGHGGCRRVDARRRNADAERQLAGLERLQPEAGP